MKRVYKHEYDNGPAALGKPIDRLRAEELQYVVHSAVIIGEEKVHDIAHDQRRYHDRKIYDRADKRPAAELFVEQHGKGNAQHILHERASKAVYDGVDKRRAHVFIRQHTGVVFQPDEFIAWGIAVPVRDGEVNALYERQHHKHGEQRQRRNVEQVDEPVFFLHNDASEFKPRTGI